MKIWPLEWQHRGSVLVANTSFGIKYSIQQRETLVGYIVGFYGQYDTDWQIARVEGLEEAKRRVQLNFEDCLRACVAGNSVVHAKKLEWQGDDSLLVAWTPFRTMYSIKAIGQTGTYHISHSNYLDYALNVGLSDTQQAAKSLAHDDYKSRISDALLIGLN